MVQPRSLLQSQVPRAGGGHSDRQSLGLLADSHTPAACWLTCPPQTSASLTPLLPTPSVSKSLTEVNHDRSIQDDTIPWLRSRCFPHHMLSFPKFRLPKYFKVYVFPFSPIFSTIIEAPWKQTFVHLVWISSSQYLEQCLAQGRISSINTCWTNESMSACTAMVLSAVVTIKWIISNAQKQAPWSHLRKCRETKANFRAQGGGQLSRTCGPFQRRDTGLPPPASSQNYNKCFWKSEAHIYSLRQIWSTWSSFLQRKNHQISPLR